MPTFTFRLPLMLSRKLRALARVCETEPGPFVRDLIRATIEGGLHAQLFEQRLKEGMARYAGREVLLGGPDAGGFTAPGKPPRVVAGRKGRRKKGKPNERPTHG
jgi:hypothetical protein